jgi:hypothetical protein
MRVLYIVLYTVYGKKLKNECNWREGMQGMEE